MVTTRRTEPSLEQWLERWQTAGIVDAEQAAAIRADEQRRVAARPARTPAAGDAALSVGNEIVAYLGSVLAIAGGAVVVARVWESIAFAARLAIATAVAALGFGAGAALIRRVDPATTRLATFMWVVGTGGVVMAIVTTTVEYGWEGPGVGVAVGVPITAIGAALWRNRPRPLQLVTSAVGMFVTATALAALVELRVWIGGIGLAAAGASVVALGLADRIAPRETSIVLGALAAIAGASMLGELDEHIGGIAAAIVAAGVVAVALTTHRTPLLVIGVLAFLQSLQVILMTTLSGPLASTIVTAVGVATVTVVIVRSLHRPTEP